MAYKRKLSCASYSFYFSPNSRRNQLVHIQNMLLQGRPYWSPMTSLHATPIFHFLRTLAAHHCHHCTHCSQQHLRTPWNSRVRNSRSFDGTCCDPQPEGRFAAVHRQLGLFGRLFVPTLKKMRKTWFNEAWAIFEQKGSKSLS